jgi:Taurine catabolism dioxygenase TauD, TfdA family
LLEVLYRPYWWGRQGNELPGQSAFYTQPIFADHGGRFFGRYTRTHIRTAELSADVDALGPDEAAALDLIDEICARAEFALTLMFEPGDMQFLNNHLTLHMRTAFTDHPEPARRRHMLRLWLALPNGPELPDSFRPFFGDTAAGAVRGGFPGHGAEQVFTTG